MTEGPSQGMQIRRATRQGVNPLIGLYAESGCGKTYSALMLARGLVGPSGQIVMIDTESGRGSLYADVIPGGYDVLELREPFSPARYIEAVKAAIEYGAKVVVIDSMSHEWEGPGSVQDMADENERRTGKPGLHNWRQPKVEHAKLVQFLLRCTVPLIVCIRAKFKTRQVKNERGKTEIVKDNHTSPIQSEDFIFECTAHGEIMPDHKLRLTKWSHPSLKECFPKDAPIEIKHGELIAKWCAGGAVTKLDDAVKGAKKRLFSVTMPIHQGDTAKLRQWLVDEAIIFDNESLEDLNTVERLAVVTSKTVEKLNAGGVAA